MEVNVTIPVEVQNQASDAKAALSSAKELTITTAAQYQGAAATLVDIKRQYNQLEKARKTLSTPIDDAKKAVQAFFRPAQQWLKEAEGHIKSSLAKYKIEEDRKQLEEQRRLNNEANAEEERLRAAKKKEAEVSEIMGDKAKASDARKEADSVSVPPPIAPTAAPRIDGIATVTRWRAFVVDIDQVPRKYMIPDIDKLNGIARAVKGASDIPGVEFQGESSVSARV